MIRFRTENSTYELTATTWKRTTTNGEKHPTAPMRTEEGPLWTHSHPVLGIGVTLIGPPIDPTADYREITTSPVTAILLPEPGEDR